MIGSRDWAEGFDTGVQWGRDIEREQAAKVIDGLYEIIQRQDAVIRRLQAGEPAP